MPRASLPVIARKLAASALAASLVWALPGCGEALAQAVTSVSGLSSPGAAVNGAVGVGSLSVVPQGLAPGLGLTSGLNPSLQGTLAVPQSVPTAVSVHQALPSAVLQVAPAAIAVSKAAPSAVLPLNESVSQVAPAAIAVSKGLPSAVLPLNGSVPQAVAGGVSSAASPARRPELKAAQGLLREVRGAAAAAGTLKTLRAGDDASELIASSAKLFDNARARDSAGLASRGWDPASPRPVRLAAPQNAAAEARAVPAVPALSAPSAASLASRAKSLLRAAADLLRRLEPGGGETSTEEEGASLLPKKGALGTFLRAGMAGLAFVGLGVGFPVVGAAAAVHAAVWSPYFAAAAGALALGALGAAAWKRYATAKPSFRTAALAALGLALVGAAAAPFITAVLGAQGLRLASLGLLVGLALLFEFLNGMHDAANSIATVVSTKTLTPRQAVLWAAFFNSIAYFVFGAHIAAAIGTGIVIPTVMSNALLAAALLGASLWNWITVKLGIPVSSSHSLIGGMVGAALVAGGLGAIYPGMLLKTALFMVVSPVLGLAAAFALMALIHHFVPDKLTPPLHKAFGGAQLFSSALLSLGHGGNDSQKTIGIISALLFANGLLGASFYVPWYVAVAAYAAMGLGTLAGGWRVIKTMGEGVTSLDRSMGTAAEVGAGASILLATWVGIPVSTTHVVTGSVAGVGAAHGGASSVKWGTLHKIAWAWVLTIPFAALVSGLLYLLLVCLL